jgi:subtilisin family serine protease
MPLTDAALSHSHSPVNGKRLILTFASLLLPAQAMADGRVNLRYTHQLHLERVREPTALLLPFPKLGGIAAFERARGIPDVLLPEVPSPIGADPLLLRDWAIRKIQLQAASFQEALSTVTVAVIDTGVDYNHEDLRNAMWRKPSDPLEVGYDFAHDHPNPYDVKSFDLAACLRDERCSRGDDWQGLLANPGHGTHCAGHVAAIAQNTRGIRGVAAGARIMALKFFYDAGERFAGTGDDEAAIRAIDYAIANGAKIISASWGGRHPHEEAQASELRNALLRARDAGILVVIAAGNDGINQDTVDDPVYPAAYASEMDHLIVVAASDQNDRLAPFSNFGERTVHLAAPGVKILSTTVGSSYSDIVDQADQIRIDWNGTSMSTPLVAGAAALIWSKFPHWSYREVRKRILDSARPVDSLSGKLATSGVLDVEAALR